MLLVLLEPVNSADSKYVFAYWIESQIREIQQLTTLKTFICPNQKNTSPDINTEK